MDSTSSSAYGISQGDDAGAGNGQSTSSAAVTAIFDGGGPVIRTVNVCLIYWGSYWENGPFVTPDAITAAATSLVSGQYLSKLAQYGVTAVGSVTHCIASDTEPHDQFTSDRVAAKLRTLIEAGDVPPVSGNQLYCFIMPPGIMYFNGTILGEHSCDTAGYGEYYAWVTNDGTLDYITRWLSHELVEACSDPTGSGIQLDAAPVCTHDLQDWCEIADVCNGTGRVGDVFVQAYWSNVDGACVIPGQDP